MRLIKKWIKKNHIFCHGSLSSKGGLLLGDFWWRGAFECQSICEGNELKILKGDKNYSDLTGKWVKVREEAFQGTSYRGVN